MSDRIWTVTGSQRRSLAARQRVLLTRWLTIIARTTARTTAGIRARARVRAKEETAAQDIPTAVHRSCRDAVLGTSDE